MVDHSNFHDSIKVELVPERIYDVIGYDIKNGFNGILLKSLVTVCDYYKLYFQIGLGEKKYWTGDLKKASKWLYYLIERYRINVDSELIDWTKFMKTMNKYYEFCKIDYFPDGIYDEDSYIEFKRFYHKEFTFSNDGEVKLELVCKPKDSGKYSHYYKKSEGHLIYPIRSTMRMMREYYWYHFEDIFNNRYDPCLGLTFRREFRKFYGESQQDHYDKLLINYLEKYPEKLSYLVHEWILGLLSRYVNTLDLGMVGMILDHNMIKFFNEELLDRLIEYPHSYDKYSKEKCVWMKILLRIRSLRTLRYIMI